MSRIPTTKRPGDGGAESEGWALTIEDRSTLEPFRPEPIRAPGQRRRRLAPVVAVLGLIAGAGIGYALTSSATDTGGGEQIVSAGADGGGLDASVLAPPAEESGYELRSVAETTIDTALGLSEELVITGYGPIDGNGTEGLLIWHGRPGELAEDPLAVHLPAPVTERDVLAELGAELVHPSLLRWDEPDRARGIAWYGSSISSDLALDIAASVATSSAIEPPELPIPAGWTQHYRTDELPEPTRAVETSFSNAEGDWFSLVTYETELPFGLFDFLALIGPDAVTRRPVELRGTTGLLVGFDLGDQQLVSSTLVWHERGRTYEMRGRGSEQVAAPPILALADQLELVDADVWQGYLEDAEQVPTSVPTTVPAPVQTTDLASEQASTPDQPPSNDQTHLTAPPGPGANPRRTESDGTGLSTTTSSPPEPVDENASTTGPPPPDPDLRPPAGSYLEDEILVVAEGSLGPASYSIGVHWSRWLGLCVGAIFEAAADEFGGYPIRCELDPYIGGGASATDSSNGTVIVVYTPATIDDATLTIDRTDHRATLHQVSELPEFTFVVFVLPGLDDANAADLIVPGAVALWQNGKPVGWG